MYNQTVNLSTVSNVGGEIRVPVLNNNFNHLKRQIEIQYVGIDFDS